VATAVQLFVAGLTDARGGMTSRIWTSSGPEWPRTNLSQSSVSSSRPDAPPTMHDGLMVDVRLLKGDR
jgi:hypothetical protein